MKIGQQRNCLLSACLILGLSSMTAHAGTVHYYYTDPQGSVLAKTDAQGNIIATNHYQPYGGQSLGAVPDGPGYTGHVEDPDTGLVYMQHRYYDPGTGQFLSADPMGPSPGNLFNYNRYDYTRDNPINHVDPDGRCVDGLTCDTMVRNYGAWASAHPKEADKLGRNVGLPLTMMMAAPTVGTAGLAILRSPLTYLAFSFTTKDLDVVEAMKAAEERQKSAELVETVKTDSKLIEELFEAAEKKDVPPPSPPPPKSPDPSSIKPSAGSPVVKPDKNHSNDQAFILHEDFSHEG